MTETELKSQFQIIEDKLNEAYAEQWVTNIYKKINSQWICVMTEEAPVTC